LQYRVNKKRVICKLKTTKPGVIKCNTLKTKENRKKLRKGSVFEGFCKQLKYRQSESEKVS